MGRGGLRLFRADFLQSPSKEDLWLREDRVKGGCVEGSALGTCWQLLRKGRMLLAQSHGIA